MGTLKTRPREGRKRERACPRPFSDKNNECVLRGVGEGKGSSALSPNDKVAICPLCGGSPEILRLCLVTVSLHCSPRLQVFESPSGQARLVLWLLYRHLCEAIGPTGGVYGMSWRPSSSLRVQLLWYSTNTAAALDSCLLQKRSPRTCPQEALLLSILEEARQLQERPSRHTAAKAPKLRGSALVVPEALQTPLHARNRRLRRRPQAWSARMAWSESSSRPTTLTKLMSQLPARQDARISPVDHQARRQPATSQCHASWDRETRWDPHSQLLHRRCQRISGWILSMMLHT